MDNELALNYKYSKGNEPRRTPCSIDVYKWPEFRALCARLGVVYQLPTTAISITLCMELPPSITQTYNGTDMNQTKSPKDVDSSNMQNDTWRTRDSLL